jgi:hypothetical protein
MQTGKTNGRRLVIIGDVHGYFEQLLVLLRHAKLIDAQQNWIGGQNRLLQIGDIFDRGPFPLEADALLEKLQLQAPSSKGEVIRLMGNHELEIMLGNFAISEVPLAQLPALQQKFIRQVLDGKLKAAYAYKGFLCTHAGVTQKLLRVFNAQLDNPDAANLAILINFIFRESVAHSFYKHPIFNISVHRSGPSSFGGVFWEDLEDLIASYKQSPFWQVIGHTPIDHVVIDQNRQMIAVDAGLHRKLQYVEISEKGVAKIVTV